MTELQARAKKPRDIRLDILKAFNIVLVVLGHCIQYGAGQEFSGGEFFDNPIFMFIYSFHMPLFMLISGYLFSHSLKSKKWYELLFAKFKQLVIPLGCWSIITLAISVCYAIAGISGETVGLIWLIKELITGFVYGPWFLWAIWWCSAVIIVVRTFFKDRPIVYIALTLLTFVIPDSLNLSLYKFMWPFFLLAYMFGAYDWKKKLKKLYTDKFFIASVFILFAALLCFYGRDSYIYTTGYSVIGKNIGEQFYNDLFRFVIGMLGSLSAIYLIFALTKILPNKIKTVLSYIGQNTMGIYLISDILIVDGLALLAAPLMGINYALIFAETVIILALCIALNALLKKIKITNKLLLGGR